ncbi:TPA: helix-turn-helix domain-containing protein [Salmonella enterica subsp. enterica serovar Typhi str. AG3]|nr:helix-turn-helix domain-containing protein [Salmonella enterica subsp. enterica serovar Typhi str. AG3]
MTGFEENLKITLRAARVNRGYKLEDVAELTSYNKDKVNRFEIDSSDIPYSMLETLLNLYQVNLKHIFLGKESDFIGIYSKRSNDKTA